MLAKVIYTSIGFFAGYIFKLLLDVIMDVVIDIDINKLRNKLKGFRGGNKPLKGLFFIGKIKDEGGYTTILMPFILSILLAFMALLMDMGRCYILKHELQAAVDAAALAAASNVKVEFASDEMGELNINETVMTIVPEIADAEAEYYFMKNVESMEFNKKGVKIVTKKGETKPDMLHYFYNVTAEIPMPLAGPILGLGGRQKVRVYAEASPEQGD